MGRCGVSRNQQPDLAAGMPRAPIRTAAKNRRTESEGTTTESKDRQRDRQRIAPSKGLSYTCKTGIFTAIWARLPAPSRARDSDRSPLFCTSHTATHSAMRSFASSCFLAVFVVSQSPSLISSSVGPCISGAAATRQPIRPAITSHLFSPIPQQAC